MKQVCVSLLLIVLSLGCSVTSTMFMKTANPAVRSTLMKSTAEYFNSVTNGREQQSLASIMYPDYLGGKSDAITVDELKSQYNWARTHWTALTTPLLDLKLHEAKTKENEGYITLEVAETRRRNGIPEKIWVRLVWNGFGWIIREDSVFGSNKLVSQMMKK